MFTLSIPCFTLQNNAPNVMLQMVLSISLKLVGSIVKIYAGTFGNGLDGSTTVHRASVWVSIQGICVIRNIQIAFVIFEQVIVSAAKDEFVARLDVPMSWDLYVANGNRKALNEIFYSSDCNKRYVSMGYAPQCVVDIKNGSVKLHLQCFHTLKVQPLLQSNCTTVHGLIENNHMLQVLHASVRPYRTGLDCLVDTVNGIMGFLLVTTILHNSFLLSDIKSVGCPLSVRMIHIFTVMVVDSLGFLLVVDNYVCSVLDSFSGPAKGAPSKRGIIQWYFYHDQTGSVSRPICIMPLQDPRHATHTTLLEVVLYMEGFFPLQEGTQNAVLRISKTMAVFIASLFHKLTDRQGCLVLQYATPLQSLAPTEFQIESIYIKFLGSDHWLLSKEHNHRVCGMTNTMVCFFSNKICSNVLMMRPHARNQGGQVHQVPSSDECAMWHLRHSSIPYAIRPPAMSILLTLEWSATLYLEILGHCLAAVVAVHAQSSDLQCTCGLSVVVAQSDLFSFHIVYMFRQARRIPIGVSYIYTWFCFMGSISAVPVIQNLRTWFYLALDVYELPTMHRANQGNQRLVYVMVSKVLQTFIALTMYNCSAVVFLQSWLLSFELIDLIQSLTVHPHILNIIDIKAKQQTELVSKRGCIVFLCSVLILLVPTSTQAILSWCLLPCVIHGVLLWVARLDERIYMVTLGIVLLAFASRVLIKNALAFSSEWYLLSPSCKPFGQGSGMCNNAPYQLVVYVITMVFWNSSRSTILLHSWCCGLTCCKGNYSFYPGVCWCVAAGLILEDKDPILSAALPCSPLQASSTVTCIGLLSLFLQVRFLYFDRGILRMGKGQFSDYNKSHTSVALLFTYKELKKGWPELHNFLLQTQCSFINSRTSDKPSISQLRFLVQSPSHHQPTLHTGHIIPLPSHSQKALHTNTNQEHHSNNLSLVPTPTILPTTLEPANNLNPNCLVMHFYTELYPSVNVGSCYPSILRQTYLPKVMSNITCSHILPFHNHTPTKPIYLEDKAMLYGMGTVMPEKHRE